MRNPLEALTAIIRDFDYQVDDDDFVFYELGRLIEEDCASFDDPDFRRLIDAGVAQNIEERLEIRAALTERFRAAAPKMDSRTREMAMKVVHALEDINVNLRNAAVIVAAYTGYLFDRLERLEPGDTRASEAADLLFDAPDRSAAENAIGILSETKSSVSARVLAHAISEPMLDETLEETAYSALKAIWPLPRNYMVYALRSHTHLDLPFRWFQLLMDSHDLEGVDLVLEECRLHGHSATFREDLASVIELLLGSRDPETEDKVIAVLNDPDTAPPVAEMLQTFLKAYQLLAPGSAWLRQDELRKLQDRYRAAAKLFDSGKPAEAERDLLNILAVAPGYHFATMLLNIIHSG